MTEINNKADARLKGESGSFCLDDDFQPPFPVRETKKYSMFHLLREARKSFLAIWAKEDFERRFINIRILNRQIVVCNEPELVKAAFQDGHDALQRKSPQMRNALSPLIGDGLFISDGETWTSRRKIVAPIVHGSRVPGFSSIMINTIEEKRQEWMALPDGAEIDALAEMAHLTAEIICRTIFGQDLGREYAAEVVEAFTDYQRHIDQVDLVSLLGLPDWIPRFRNSAIKKSIRRIHNVLDKIIDQFAPSRAQGSNSVLGGLLDACDDNGNPLSREAIRNEAAVIFMAGHETTANTLAWAWFLLSQSPHVAQKLYAEVDTVLGDGLPSFKNIKDLRYTKAVFEETLRLYPPVPILAREAMDDIEIDGQLVQKGAILMVVPWLLHRNPHLWEHPNNFCPERHLASALGQPATKRSKYSYVPFSIGPRICPGLAFGIAEGVLSLAILARSLRLELKHGEDVQPVCRLTLRPGEKLPMVLKRRN